MEKKTLGKFIAILRKAKGMTQQELAEKLNVSNKAVSKWECDETSPDISIVPVIAEILGVSCDELLRGERITSGVQNEKTEKRGEKQLKFLTGKGILKYKEISLISIALVFVGLVSMFTFSYSLFRPDVGFAVAVSIFFIAAITQIFAINRLNGQTADNELLSGESSSLLKSLYNVKYKYSFWIFYAVFFLTVLMFPLVAVRDNQIIKSVLSFEAYLTYVPFVAVVPVAAFFPFNELYKNFIYKNPKLEKNKKSLLILDLIQVGLLCPCALSYCSDFADNYRYFSAVFCMAAIALSFAVAAIKSRNKQTVLQAAFLSIRNLAYLCLFILPFTIFLNYLIIVSATAVYLIITKKQTLPIKRQIN